MTKTGRTMETKQHNRTRKQNNKNKYAEVENSKQMKKIELIL